MKTLSMIPVPGQGWLNDWGHRSTEQRCRDLEEQLNSRPDTGKLWRNMQKIGRIVNLKSKTYDWWMK